VKIIYGAAWLLSDGTVMINRPHSHHKYVVLQVFMAQYLGLQA